MAVPVEGFMVKKTAKSEPAQLEPLEGEEAFREFLRKRCSESSAKQVAEAAGLDPSYLSNILAGRSSLGSKTVARFGYKRVEHVTFIPLD